MTWRDGEHQRVHVGGTGSISCRGLTEEQGQAAEHRKQPIGFRSPLVEAIAEVVSSSDVLRSAAVGRMWGEALWTARDIARL